MDSYQYYVGCSFLIVLVQSFLAGVDAGGIGVCYGRVADNLPPPSDVAALYKAQGIKKMRMFDVEPTVLDAFANTGIEVIVGVPNEALPTLAGSVDAATQWLTTNIIPHIPATNITYISVGNEIIPDTPFVNNLVPAMQNLWSAINSHNLQNQIKVSTTHMGAVLSNSYPPSAGAFNPQIAEVMHSVLNFLGQTGAPYMANVYPYFAYNSNTKDIPLDYALFKPNAPPVTDGPHTYHSLFDAMVDAIISAMEALGVNNVPVIITETGWPSDGSDTATIPDAQDYNNAFIQHILSNAGTPMRPNEGTDAYVFAMFNEDQKPGAATEQHFGLFYPDKTPVYPVKFS